MQKKLRVLTWHIHGNYLYYLTQAPFEFYLPKGEGEGYGGCASGFDWGKNVHDVPIEQVRELDFDVILFQHRKNYEVDQYEISGRSGSAKCILNINIAGKLLVQESIEA